MYSFVVNMDQKDKSYVGTWHYAYCNGAPFVYIGDGGKEIIELVQGPSFYASCEYLIAPDGSWEHIPGGPDVGDDFFSSKGIIEHVCKPVYKKENFSLNKNSQVNPLIIDVENNSLIMNVFADNVYSIKIYNANGQVVGVVPNKTLNKGNNILNIGSLDLSGGTYFTDIQWGDNKNRQKIIIK